MSEENTMKKWKEKSVCTLDFIEAISTFGLTGAAPMASVLQTERDRRVQCSPRVMRSLNCPQFVLGVHHPKIQYTGRGDRGAASKYSQARH
jgi:hypothetical protein